MSGGVSGGCAVWVCECVHGAYERGVLSGGGAEGSGWVVAGKRKDYAACEAEAGRGCSRGPAPHAEQDRDGGYGGAGGERLRLGDGESQEFFDPGGEAIEVWGEIGC